MSATVMDLGLTRLAQQRWAEVSVRERMRVLRAFRHEVAGSAEALATRIPRSREGSLYRTHSDTLIAEVLPLMEACRYLEREADFVLAPRTESTHTRPFWLGGVSIATRREPLGVVLIIAPANYPLFLPGVQALQALAAGNAVLWKPAPGGEGAAQAMRLLLVSAGLDAALLKVLDPTTQAARMAMDAGVDKVFLTGSAATGRAVLHGLADTLTPSVMELSGCDAVFVLPGTDLGRAVDAIVFGTRINGSATCMAPRRIFVAAAVAEEFTRALTAAIVGLPPVPVPQTTRDLLRDLVDEATLYGAALILDGQGSDSGLRPTLIGSVTPDMRVTQTDIFAPVLSLLTFNTIEEALALHAVCPYALTAAVFAPEKEAQLLAARLKCGTVLINDVIVSTADPRASFGGRGQSGFGSTRGREGLLEMTAAKTVIHQRRNSRVPYQPTTVAHGELFAAYIQTVHAGRWSKRWRGLRRLLRAARNIKI